jgi:chromosome partitioning protein
MTTVSFLHQKGGTGKSTLSIAAALALAQSHRRVLLIDADYQGTSSEWGNRFGHRGQVEIRSQVQPILEKEVARFRPNFDWIVIDAPPALSPMTESVVRASDRVIIPVRPSLPDIWALPWLAAIIAKLAREGKTVGVRVVFNQHGGEDLTALREEIAFWHLPVHPRPLPLDPAFQAVFAGEALPGPLAEQVLELVLDDGG